MRDAGLIRRVDILFEDDDLLVVNKPAGLLTVPGRQESVSLREAIAHATGIERPLRLVHRLDRQTSGVLVLAKTLHAQRAMTEQFGNRNVVKDYLAIVRGQPDTDQGLIDTPLAPHPRRGHQMIVTYKGKPPQTARTVVECWASIALLRCRPLTGRQHQIRVHLAYIGLPLLVDEPYGRSTAFYLSEIKADYRLTRGQGEQPLIARLTLHAERIRFTHPSRDEPMNIEAPLPKDFRATLNQLRQWAPIH